MAGFVRRYATVALLAVLVLFRLPAFIFGVMDIDETDFLVSARMMAHGAIPYVDVVEKKPILAYLFYWPTTVFGFRLWPMQILSMCWIFATCWVLGRAAERWTRRPIAGFAASGLFILAVSASVLSVNLEMMFNLPTALALWFFIRRETGGSAWNELGCGIAIGVASLFKHQAGITLGAFMIALTWQWWKLRKPRLASHALLLLGFAVPWLATVWAYSRLGHLHEFYEWNVARNLFYAGGQDPKWLVAWHFFEGGLFYAALSAPIAWWLALRNTRRGGEDDPIKVMLIVTFLVTWLPVSLGGRFYNHYYLQFLPSLCLLAAPLAADWLEKPRHPRRVFALLSLPLIFYCFYYVVIAGLLNRHPAQDKNTILVSTWIRENSRPDERLFVWGHQTPIYYLSQRLPGTRYYNTSVHMGDFDPGSLYGAFDPAAHKSQLDVDNTLVDLEKNRPALVVDTAPCDIHHWGKVPLDAFPEIDGYVHAHYQLVAEPGRCRVYRRMN